MDQRPDLAPGGPREIIGVMLTVLATLLAVAAIVPIVVLAGSAEFSHDVFVGGDTADYALLGIARWIAVSAAATSVIGAVVATHRARGVGVLVFMATGLLILALWPR